MAENKTQIVQSEVTENEKKPSKLKSALSTRKAKAAVITTAVVVGGAVVALLMNKSGSDSSDVQDNAEFDLATDPSQSEA